MNRIAKVDVIQEGDGLPIKISTKGQVVLPAKIRKKYNIEAGKEVEILDFGGEIVIVPVPETRGRGLVKFRRRPDEILAEYKEEEKKREMER
ncbi:AbrB/MazE/SpoVT family DNA-binding domain-containing protein [Geoglobus acetivorans]|uniref:AbrB/MazE/SpoVT family DNA-binding domain-containing protein n=1 Tax=Geoglobus acetivorans TaxID=565033 RepID=A0ABZ3H1B7_GEOAI|nr:AbrB/MazE/SpoVT family DNA-binding domain-containing protein [Geoglobus acetivorans]